MQDWLDYGVLQSNCCTSTPPQQLKFICRHCVCICLATLCVPLCVYLCVYLYDCDVLVLGHAHTYRHTDTYYTDTEQALLVGCVVAMASVAARRVGKEARRLRKMRLYRAPRPQPRIAYTLPDDLFPTKVKEGRMALVSTNVSLCVCRQPTPSFVLSVLLSLSLVRLLHR